MGYFDEFPDVKDVKPINKPIVKECPGCGELINFKWSTNEVDINILEDAMYCTKCNYRLPMIRSNWIDDPDNRYPVKEAGK